MSEKDLQPMEKEILLEIGNATINAASQSLGSFVSGAINAKPPAVKIVSMEELLGVAEKGLFVTIVFHEGVAGQQFLFFPAASGALLAALLLGKDPPATPPQVLDEMEQSALSEVVGMLMGVYTTSLSGFIGRSVEMDPPQIETSSPAEKDYAAAGFDNAEQWVVLEFALEFESDNEAIFFQYIPYPLMKEIVAPLIPEESGAKTPEKTTDLPGTQRDASIEDTTEAEAAEATETAETEEALSEMQLDALAEIGNISLGASATALSELLRRRVQITTPAVNLTTMQDVRASYPLPCLVITVNYSKGLAGNNVLILKNDDALSIVGVMMGMEPPEKPPQLGEMELSGIGEAMNQMMGASATAMSDFFGRLIDISPPRVESKDLHSESLDVTELGEDSPVVKITFNIEVDGLLDSTLLQLIPLPFAREMASSLLASMGFPEPGATDSIMGDVAVPPTVEEEESISSVFNFLDTDDPKETEALSHPGVIDRGAKTFSASGDHDSSRIDMIRDIPINIHVLLGKARLPLRKIFSMLPGEIIALERYLGEAVDIYANDRLVAKGEVVMVNGQFGIKIIDMFSSP